MISEKERTDLAECISKEFFCGKMGCTFYRLIDKCLYEYGFEKIVVYLLFAEAYKKRINYNATKMEELAQEWYGCGYTDSLSVADYFETQQRIYVVTCLMGKLLRRRLNGLDLDRIVNWCKEFNATPEFVEYAFRVNEYRDCIHINHIENKLKEWYSADIVTLDEAKAYEHMRHMENKMRYLERINRCMSPG